jgi:putative Holliday junction resolvase
MPEAAPPRGFVLGFDFGLKRIGIAVAQTTTATASALQTVSHRQQPDWVAIERLVREWRPGLFVVGLPLGIDGEETSMSRAARQFGQALQTRFERDCVFVDERLSSRAAHSRFVGMRAEGIMKRKHADKLDSMAAQIILETWLKSSPDPT